MRAVFAKIEDETKVRKESTLEHEQHKVQVLENAYAHANEMYEKAKSVREKTMHVRITP